MIEIKSLVKKFKDKTVIDQISFSVSEGEILFILGTSGTGKSVLLKLLVGLLRADGGTIAIDGKDITNLSEEEYFEIRKKCGMVFQQPALFDSLSVYENIAYGLRRLKNFSEKEIQERVKDCLQKVHLKDIENKMPHEISYGMQKRVSLARTIALEPKILLFDEPTTGLDPITTRSVNLLIRELSHQLRTTSIVVSHDIACAFEAADKLIMLHQGKIVEQGGLDNFRNSKIEIVQGFLKELNQGAII